MPGFWVYALSNSFFMVENDLESRFSFTSGVSVRNKNVIILSVLSIVF